MKRSTKKIIKPCVLGLFPVPIYVAFLNRKFSKQEAKTIQKLTLTYVPNQGNDTSKNNYILEVKELKKLKLELENILQDYIKKIYDPVTDIKGYITQSWLNVAKKGDYHHKHAHPNSFLSGIIYFKADKKFDKIFFESTNYRFFKPDMKTFNIFNSDSWWLPVETGKILIFPANAPHAVHTKEENHSRISLSFNTFFKGTIGKAARLTELKL